MIESMKKLVVVAAIAAVCGGSFAARAKTPVQQPTDIQTQCGDTVVTDTTATVTVSEPVQDAG